MSTEQQIVTPVGRIVWGHPSKGKIKTNYHTKKPELRDGQQVTEYVFGLAIPKTEFQTQLWPIMYSIAQSAFPQAIPAEFKYKFKDGDAPDQVHKTGHAGHFILTVSTEIAPQVFKANSAGGYDLMGPDEIKCGDFVDVNVTLKYNGAPAGSTCGLYVNPNGVRFIGYGEEIINGPSAETLFGNAAPAALPPGASVTPIASSTMPGMPGMQPVSAPTMPAPATAPAALMPQPAHDFVQNAGTAPLPQTMPGMPTP